MEEFKTLAVANLTTIFAAINTEKGDSLLDTSSLTDRYHTWELPDARPPYPVFFLQFIDENPEVIAQTDSGEAGLLHTVTISTIIAIDGVPGNIPKMKARYNRAVLQFIKDYIAPDYSDVMITNVNAVVGVDEQGDAFELSEVSFEFSLVV